MKWVIIGTGRCGSKYVAEVLKSAGVQCGHEEVFNTFPSHLQRFNEYDADSSFMAAEYLGTSVLRGMTVVHLVRRPKHVIDSFSRMWLWKHPAYGRYREWIRRQYPVVDDYEDYPTKTAVFYVEQNLRIEAYAHVRHRIEDDATDLLNKLQIDYEGKELFDDKRCNHRPAYSHYDLGLNDFPGNIQNQLLDIGRRYGYAGWG